MIATLASLSLTSALAALPAEIEPGTQNFNYTFAELNITHGDPDIQGADSKVGFDVGGSFRVWKNLYVRANFLDVDKLQTIFVGAGWAHPIGEKADIFGQFALGKVEAGPADESGWELDGGVRWWATDQIEVDGLLGLIDADGSEVTFGVGGRWHMNENLSFGVSYQIINDVANFLRGGARWQF